MKVMREEDTPWPTVTVIMAALNEQDLITRAIDSVFASNYPKDKLELICVNDGSTDLTLTYMQRARQKYGDRLQGGQLPKNLGKRKALYVGIKSAKGDVVVTFDSDSLLGRNALRNIVLPLIQDPRTVCVAGRVAVLNEKQNFLTRMLSVRYSVAFDYGRAYQSTFGTVVCCPGALTAYNKPIGRRADAGVSEPEVPRRALQPRRGSGFDDADPADRQVRAIPVQRRRLHDRAARPSTA